MQRITIFYFLLLFCTIYSVYPQIESECIMHIEHITRVQDIVFTHTMSSNAHQKNMYKINGQLVDEKEYYEQLDTAEYQDRLYEREKNIHMRQKKLETMQRLKLQTLKKIIFEIVHKVQHRLDILQQNALQDYYAYNPETIGSRAMLDRVFDMLASAQERAEQLYNEQDEEALRYLVKQVEQVPDRLEQFFQETVQLAIEHCEDTKMLKELLSFLNPDFAV